jgi:hypothetical protein
VCIVCKVKFIFECVLIFSILIFVKHDVTISVAFYIIPREINVQNKNTLLIHCMCIQTIPPFVYLFITFLPVHQSYG